MVKKKLQWWSVLLLLLLSILSAGGSTSESTPPFSLVTRGSRASIASNELKTVTAHCLPGETALGGGYSASPDDGNSSLVIEGSYPDGVPTPTVNVTPVRPNGWAVTVFNSGAGNGTVVIVAYCLEDSSPQVTLQLSFEEYPNEMDLQSTPGRSQGPYVLCPIGTTTLSGGFRVSFADQQKASRWNAGVTASEPHRDNKTGLADGWSVSLTAYNALKGVNAFALCATSHALRSVKAVESLIHSPLSPEAVSAATCDGKAFSVGGGFQMDFYDPSALASPRRVTASWGKTSNTKVWTTTAYGDQDMQLHTSVACFAILTRSTWSAA